MGRILIQSYIGLTLCILLSAFGSFSQATKQAKHLEVSLRMIGHQVLLNAEDSTSIVLPITQEGEQYRISFQNEFGIIPEELSSTVSEVMTQTGIASGYFLEVLSCESGKVVYSFEKGMVDRFSLMPCAARELPKACYDLILTMAKEEQSIAKVEPLEQKSQSTWIVIVILILLAVLLIVWLKKRKPKAKADLLSIGKFQFNEQTSELFLGSETIELSSKEAQLLSLLNEHLNLTIKKEVLLNKVWGDEGDYVGRTLDVFISKLRKKLEGDDNIKISNVRGVGYKLLVY
jgi:DNA-binding response OmpR family regulator